MSKLSHWTILVIGIGISLVALSYGFFWNYRPNMEEASNYNANADALEMEAAKLPQAQKRVKNAQALVDAAARDWESIVQRKTPSTNVATGGVNLAVNRWQLTVDARRFRNNIQKALNNQLRKGGVEVVSGPLIPQFSQSAKDIVESGFNYPAIPFPVLIYDLGTVTVRGSLQQIFDHIRAWNSFPGYMAVTDGLAINGTSPKLTATYNLSMVGYIRGDRIFPPVPEAGEAQGGGQGAAPGPITGPSGVPGPPGAPPGGGPTTKPRLSQGGAG